MLSNSLAILWEIYKKETEEARTNDVGCYITKPYFEGFIRWLKKYEQDNWNTCLPTVDMYEKYFPSGSIFKDI